ncbi:hypothetical protein JNK13_08175 [bacterium]|nr:hypothetical protein [bacterium]
MIDLQWLGKCIKLLEGLERNIRECGFEDQECGYDDGDLCLAADVCKGAAAILSGKGEPNKIGSPETQDFNKGKTLTTLLLLIGGALREVEPMIPHMQASDAARSVQEAVDSLDMQLNAVRTAITKRKQQKDFARAGSG